MKRWVLAGVLAVLLLVGTASATAPTSHYYMNKTYEGSPPAGGDAGVPVADFVANLTTVDVGGAVSLTDLSTNTPTSWKWTVKSNTVETWNYYYTQNPVLTNDNCAGLSRTGEIMIILNATNANGTGSLQRVDYIAVIDPDDEYGAASANVTGYLIGGGDGYANAVTTGDYIVNSKATLLSALGSASAGETIYVQPGAPIDLTGELPKGIPAGVTLASNRGVSGSPGATITKTEHTTGYVGNTSTGRWSSNTDEEPMFFVMGDDVRITGLQLVGEEYGQDGGGGDVDCCNEGDNWCDSGIPGPCANNYLVGIFSRSHDNLTVDNCEIYGWAWSGIQTAWTTDTYVHHNYIHDNNARSEGYGGSQYGGEVVYEANLYNNNRHSITSSGLEDETYTARYNIVIGDGDAIGASHFDVHENEDLEDNTAGDVFYIHHNTFMDGDDDMASVHIRTRPATGAYIYNNLFQAVSSETMGGVPIYQTFHTGDGYSDFANFFATNNTWITTVYPDNDDIAWFQLV